MTTLRQIANELREFAAMAHGDPPSVRITAKTLREYAQTIEAFLSERLAPTK